jgi:predicted HTH transcriptional regulator
MVNQQRKLIFNNPIARQQDPETSHEAAEFITTTGIRANQCRWVLKAVLATPGLTASELAKRHNIDHPIMHKRLPDLRKKGLVCNLTKRTCAITRRTAMTWCATTALQEGIEK